jgi:hypothetical protein
MESPTVTPNWRTSSYSGNGGTSCIEAGHLPGAILIRDTTQHRNGPVVQVTPAAWRTFTSSIRE